MGRKLNVMRQHKFGTQDSQLSTSFGDAISRHSWCFPVESANNSYECIRKCLANLRNARRLQWNQQLCTRLSRQLKKMKIWLQLSALGRVQWHCHPRRYKRLPSMEGEGNWRLVRRGHVWVNLTNHWFVSCDSTMFTNGIFYSSPCPNFTMDCVQINVNVQTRTTFDLSHNLSNYRWPRHMKHLREVRPQVQ